MGYRMAWVNIQDSLILFFPTHLTHLLVVFLSFHTLPMYSLGPKLMVKMRYGATEIGFRDHQGTGWFICRFGEPTRDFPKLIMLLWSLLRTCLPNDSTDDPFVCMYVCIYIYIFVFFARTIRISIMTWKTVANDSFEVVGFIYWGAL